MIAAPYLYRYRQKIPRTHTQTAPKAGSDDEQGVKGSESLNGGTIHGFDFACTEPNSNVSTRKGDTNALGMTHARPSTTCLFYNPF